LSIARRIAVRAFEAHQFTIAGRKFDCDGFVLDDTLSGRVGAQVEVLEFDHEAGCR
jgi:hypothetical protein